MERKLVTLRKVSEIKPIENADFIELVRIDGWQCVVKKGDFKFGDIGLYFEIDSFLPIEPRFEFLRKSCYKKLVDGTEGFRLKTVKLKGCVSQGLLLPLSLFPEITQPNEDYAGLLGVIKYEPPLPANLKGMVKGLFPSFIKRTDQERIQNLPDYFELYKDWEFEITEKLDGTSATFYWNNGVFGLCSRNLELKPEDEFSVYSKIAKELNLKNMLSRMNRNIALQGEIVGEGINKNPLKIRGAEFHVFDIYDIDLHRLMTPNERNDLISSLANSRLKQVPVIKEYSKTFYSCHTIEQMLEYAKGKSKIYPNAEREGLVFKSCKLDSNAEVISFKAVNNDYLLEEK